MVPCLVRERMFDWTPKRSPVVPRDRREKGLSTYERRSKQRGCRTRSIDVCQIDASSKQLSWIDRAWLILPLIASQLGPATSPFCSLSFTLVQRNRSPPLHPQCTLEGRLPSLVHTLELPIRREDRFGVLANHQLTRSVEGPRSVG